MLIGVVGPCTAGKSTLITRLKEAGYACRHIAQEHSYVPDMWLRLTNPDILVYLHVSYAVSLRRKRMNWTEKEYEVQLERLRHARQHAHILIDTDPLTPEQVFERVVEYLD